MEIGYFASKFPYCHDHDGYACGGSILAAYHLALAMAKLNYDIKVFTTSHDSHDCVECSNDIKIIRYGTNLRFMSSNISLNHFLKPLDHDIDIAHVHFDIPPGPLAGLLYAYKKKVPLIVTYHGDWLENYGGIPRRVSLSLNNKFLTEKLLNRASAIISPSAHYAAESKYLSKHRDKTIIVPNGIDLDEYNVAYSKEYCRKVLGLPLDKTILLFLGYFSPHKGPDILMTAMQKIVKEMPDVMLIFVGDGVMNSELHALAEKLGLKDHIKFVGFVGDTSRKVLYYKSADLFIMPSLAEAFGIVNLEAMACGLPIIASRTGGIPDIVRDGENGWLFQPGNSNELATYAINLLQDDNARKRLIQNSLCVIKDYSWEHIAQQIGVIYNDLPPN